MPIKGKAIAKKQIKRVVRPRKNTFFDLKDCTNTKYMMDRLFRLDELLEETEQAVDDLIEAYASPKYAKSGVPASDVIGWLESISTLLKKAKK